MKKKLAFDKWALFITHFVICIPIFINLSCRMTKIHMEKYSYLPFLHSIYASVFYTSLMGKLRQRKSLLIIN
jgi:hypothetical protein